MLLGAASMGQELILSNLYNGEKLLGLALYPPTCNFSEKTTSCLDLLLSDLKLISCSVTCMFYVPH